MHPDAVLVAVNPQDALVLKYLMDTGADMEMFLRAPGNDTLTPMLPVDQEYLINRFQLHLGAPVNFANVPMYPALALRSLRSKDRESDRRFVRN